MQSKIGRALARHVDAEDALQDTWIALHRIHRGAGPNEIDSSLLKHACYRRITELARFHTNRCGEPLIDDGDQPTTLDVGIQVLEERDERARLRARLGQLREEYRHVLVLRHWLGSPWEEIATAMGRASTHAAYCLHTRAVRALKAKLQRRE